MERTNFEDTLVTFRIELLSFVKTMAIWALYRQLFASKLGRRIFAALLLLALFLGGVQLRRWIGESTRHVRYQHDIVNGFYWGSETMKEARRLAPDRSRC